MSDTRVLGVDLACRSWGDNGSALLAFGPDGWRACRVRVVRWPDGPVTPDAMAAALDAAAREHRVSAVCLDGPQGWREPGVGPGDRPGCGRLAEYEVRAQGKVGEYGRTYPRNQSPWITFCIAVFDRLLARPGVVLANDPAAGRVAPPAGGYVLAEVFPTSVWRASGLPPLPGKARTTLGRLDDGRRWVTARYGMPAGFVPDAGSHDDLQAVVAALPGVGLLGGPAVPEPNGVPARVADAAGAALAHRVEGLIWDARPAVPGELPIPAVEGGGGPPRGDGREAFDRAAEWPRHATEPPAPGGEGNPILPDDRDEVGDEALSRGVRLFRRLAERAEAGETVGVGYATFAAAVYDADGFAAVRGRGYLPSDTGQVVELAEQVTAAAGGPLALTLGGAALRLGMDSFVWPESRPHALAGRALDEHRRKYGYTAEQWEAAFPAASRRVLDLDEARREANG